MAQRAARITCPRCGANNFDTVSVCWKCQLALQASALPPQQGMMPPNTGAMPAPGTVPPLTMPQGQERIPPAMSAYGSTQATGDFGVARRAAILFALTLPFISLPVGWTFMMIEDQRRQAIGRICVWWSCIALIFHLLLGFVVMQSMTPYLQAIVGTAMKLAPQSSDREMGSGMSTGGRP